MNVYSNGGAFHLVESERNHREFEYEYSCSCIIMYLYSIHFRDVSKGMGTEALKANLFWGSSAERCMQVHKDFSLMLS